MSKFAPHRGAKNQPRATSSTTCQKCLGKGHYTYECKGERPYVPRLSRTKQLEDPKLFEKLREEVKPSVEVPEEFKRPAGTANKILEAKEMERAKVEKDSGKGKDKEVRKRRRSSRSTDSRSSSSSSSSDSESDDSGSSSSSSDSDSERSRSRSRSPHKKRVRKDSRSRSSSRRRSVSRSP